MALASLLAKSIGTIMPPFRRWISPQLRKPSKGFWGFVTFKILDIMNAPVEAVVFEKLEAKNSDNVLEIGFGYATGLSYVLDTKLRSGTGILYGVDHSSTACQSVKKALAGDVASGKLQIFNADVANMPIDDETIDNVFHVHNYYFWPDLSAAASEIMRVMKPGGLVVTGTSYERLNMASSSGLLPNTTIDPELYMDALRTAGFLDVRKETSYIDSCQTEITFMIGAKPSSN